MPSLRFLRALAVGALAPLSAMAAGAAPASAPARPAAAPRSNYSGHGAHSVDPAILAKFAPTQLPPEVSRRIQSMLDVRSPGAGMLTPDGKQLFFSWGVTGTTQVWRIDGPQHFPTQLTGGEDRTGLEDISPDGSYVLLSRDRNGEENPGLYWMDIKGGPLHVIQHLPNVQTFLEFVSDDGNSIFFRSNDVKPDAFTIYRYDRKRGTREAVFQQDGLWSVSDFQKDRLLLAKALGSDHIEYYEYSLATKALTPLFGQNEREEYAAMYGAAPGELLVQTNKLGNFRRLYRWKQGGTLVPVTPEMPHDVDSFTIDHARKRILFQVNEDGYTRLDALDARTFKALHLPKLPAADHVVVASVSRDGRYATLGVSSGTQPVVTYVLDWNGGKLTQWQQPSAPEVDLATFVPATLESYPARDGTRIPMFVRRPKQCSPAPCPVVVMFHGGPEGQATPGFSPIKQLFVDAGFVLVEPNVRGSEGYGKAWLHSDDGPKRLNVITDIEDASRYVRKAFAANGVAPRVGIFGGSYGGYSTLVGMTLFAGSYDAGVEIVGMSNLVTFLENTAPYRRPLRISEYGDPVKDREALTRLSPITYVDQVKAPLMLIQGASDPRVPVGEAVQIHDALAAKHLDAPLVIFPDEGHGAQKRGNVVEQYGLALHFFEEQLKSKPVTAPPLK